MTPDTRDNAGARLVFVLASTVVVVAGMKAAAPILLPFFLALFLAILILPLVRWLTQRNIPAPVAVTVSVLAEVAVINSWTDQARDVGLPVESLILSDIINTSSLFAIFGSTLQRLASFFSYAFLVVLLMLFILQEASVFPDKVKAMAVRPNTDFRRYGPILQDVQRYLGIKSLVSLATGIILGLWCWIMGLDFPVLLGIVAFLLNFVPTIGSVLAGIPAVILALIQFGFGHALAVGAGYAVVNTVLGNIIEPNLMGRRLGLSTLVVLLSLVFWGWLWGPVGMILSVPLTMVLKIWLENTDDFRWIGILLDKNVPLAATPSGTTLMEDERSSPPPADSGGRDSSEVAALTGD
jgi:predicted PurR-regulated permease PerM